MPKIDLGKVTGQDGKGVPAGGSAGQVLSKRSGTDDDTEWIDMPTGTGGSPLNLLDNSDFANPVNQRGRDSYTGNVYTIDRWTLWSENGNGELRVENSQITLDPKADPNVSIAHRFQKGALSQNKSYTLAYARAGDGAIFINNNPVSWLEGFDYIEIATESVFGVQWAALYEGFYTAETLPPYVPKGYGAELAECQRYFLTDVGAHMPGHGGVMADKEFFINIPTPATMRITPTAILDYADNVVFGTTSGYTLNKVIGIKRIGKKVNGIYVALSLDSQPPQHYAVGATFATTLTFSADL